MIRATFSSSEDEDGFFEVYEVLASKLAAELVVLSACNTGVGRLQRGEGLLGAARAFQYAGVPSMVVSLWSVEDRATARIMEHFYRHLKSGSNKRQALWQAKLDYLGSASGSKREPFFWAPFVLIGDARPMSLPGGSFPLWTTALTILPLIALALFLRRRARKNRETLTPPAR